MATVFETSIKVLTIIWLSLQIADKLSELFNDKK
jgi:hypothetical protein